MLVAVTGSTGLIGTALVRRLEADGHQVLRFTRSRPSGPGQSQWDPMAGRIDADALARADAVVHLAGRGIGDGLRWTRKIKDEILQSRVRGTRLLAETMAGAAGSGGPRVLVCASGVHRYGDGGDRVLTESSPDGNGFLAGVVRQWEAAADPARAAGLRVVHIRNGIVQAAGAPVVARQLPLFRLGLGGRLGSGRQWWCWIALDDTVGLYRHALLTDDLEGPVNGTAPNPVTNAEYTATLARVLGRPGFLAAPELALRLLLGELAEELLFPSLRVQPAAALASGYAFSFPELEPALRHILGRPRP
ncbi:MAG TPA: TIGR01777 family oxidoreductase [Actinomycetota bacterium]|nr:TIGR01777 family oxidoreductase [Actinomycetota bacterium]